MGYFAPEISMIAEFYPQDYLSGTKDCISG
jgi:hypothetical protein